ncbi:hypothetical protein OG519_27420 [Streptomyces sp. NBC_01190]|nr:hypothetical protein OG519_27420 [Streptomyces sp. NBC_01190]
MYVPVRRGPAGAVVRLWRTPFGTRTAVAFTSDQRLRSVLGPTHPWIRLSEAALRRLAEPLGALHLTVDPLLTARPPAAPTTTEPAAPTVSTTPTAPTEPVQPTEPARSVESAAPPAGGHGAPDRQQSATTTP